MTQKANIEKLQQGITPLREQWDAREGMWRIVKFTGKSWIRLDDNLYEIKTAAIKTIDNLISSYPETYCKDTTE